MNIVDKIISEIKDEATHPTFNDKRCDCDNQDRYKCRFAKDGEIYSGNKYGCNCYCHNVIDSLKFRNKEFIEVILTRIKKITK